MKILQVSTHATLRPRYGGQLRSHYIGQKLEAGGLAVSRIAVCWPVDQDVDDPREPIVDLRLSDFWSSTRYRGALAGGPHLHDFYSAEAVASSPELMNRLLSRIESSQPDVILLEHPWMWPLVKKLPRVNVGPIRVVYSSHNVEAVLKRRLLDDASVHWLGDELREVKALERNLVLSAWATVACTQADADTFVSWGAKRVIVANNGTVLKNREPVVGVLPSPLFPAHRFVLFVGSKYLPNISGFFKYLAPALAKLRLNQRIVIAGGMCEVVDEQIAESSLRYCVNQRLISLGYVEDFVLDALIANASAIVLPIEYGGGSHLKTAEALASRRPVIGTTSSFRGFMQFRDLPQVTIADTPDEFECAIRRSLDGPKADLADVSVPPEVLWDVTLEPLVELLRSMDS